MRKKILVGLLIAVSVTCFSGCGSSSDQGNNTKEEVVTKKNADEKDENDLTFDYYELDDGTLEIQGYDNKDKVKIVEIPDTIDGKKVSVLNLGLFRSNEVVEEIILPESLKIIEDQAFLGATALRKLEINGIETMGDYCIYGCPKIKEVRLPEGLKELGESAIENCENLTDIYLPSTLETIDEYNFDLLGEKVKEGVEVRALFDAFGNLSNNKPLKKKHIKAIRDKGIEIVKFDPFKFPYINHALHRDHRKIVVIDGKIGYTGGMNIANYYIKGLPEIGDWRDMHIRIEGNAVNELQNIFLTMWNKSTKQHISGSQYYPLRNDSTFKGNKNVAIVDRIPKKEPKLMRQTYIKSIDAAQDKIQIVNPYFTPIPSIKKAIKRALKRGVEVEIMIPGKSDIPFTPDAAFYTANKLRKKGAKIYVYNGGFHHSKIMMVDSLFCTVGSTNLNSRSLRYDYEVNAFIFDKETTHELSTMFDHDKLDSTLLTKEEYKKRSGWKRFVGWFANLFSPFL